MAKLKELWLEENDEIGDVGITAIAKAIRKGGKKLKTIGVSREYVHHPRLVAACRQHEITIKYKYREEGEDSTSSEDEFNPGDIFA